MQKAKQEGSCLMKNKTISKISSNPISSDGDDGDDDDDDDDAAFTIL